MAKWFNYVFSLMVYAIPLTGAHAQFNKFVQTLEDFKFHTNHHIQNVILLGLYVYEVLGKNQFSVLSRQEVIDYLSLHDQAKTLSVQELRSYGYTHELSLAERLYAFYGKNIQKLRASEKAELGLIIQELNRIDKLICERYLVQNGYSNADGSWTPKGLMLKQIENIADITERAKNPVSVEEFGKSMENPHRYLLSRKHQKLAEQLLQNYESVAASYSEDLELRHNTMTCEKFFS